MPSSEEIVNVDAEVPGAVAATGTPVTAAQKIANTLREISKPDEDAGGMELSLASLAMALEQGIGEQLQEKQATGELDDFVLSLTRFLALHRSDDARMLVVLELPRRDLPAGTRLHLLDEAIAAADKAESPF